MNNSYTKKPIRVKAFDFLKTKVDDKGKYLYDGIEKRDDGKEWYFINTLEGKHYITEDDFIIFGIKGEKYPCKRDIFFATYQKEEECNEEITIIQENKPTEFTGFTHYHHDDVAKIILTLIERNEILAKPDKDVEICIELLKVVEKILKSE